MMDARSPSHRQFQPPAVNADDIRISVIIPAYNMGRLLVDSLESVLAQTVAPCEIIVVNNGSTDDTDHIVAPYRDRILYKTLMPNQGVSKARNTGAESATGTWYLFLDGDDRLFPGAIAAFQTAAARGGAGLIYGRTEQRDITTGQRRERTYCGLEMDPPGPAARNFWRALIPSPGAAIVHREVHNLIGGFAKPWQPTEDRDYWLKCGMTTPFAFCDAFVLEKLYRPASMRIFSDRAVFWGLKVQMEFVDWCHERGLATDFLQTNGRKMVRHALQRALANRDGAVIGEIRDYAATKAITIPPLLRIRCALAQRAARTRAHREQKQPVAVN